MIVLAVRGGSVASVCVALGGCATVVTPPEAVRDPVSVYVLDYGYHASLAARADDGRVVEYAYGEWGWYAEGRRGWWRAPGVVLWPSQGALGRRIREGVTAPAPAEMAVWSGAETAIPVRVERASARAWLERMGAAWDAGKAERSSLLNESHAMEFVRVPEEYWIFRTCNSAVARWLREMGCETSGVTVTAEFELAEERVAEQADQAGTNAALGR